MLYKHLEFKIVKNTQMRIALSTLFSVFGYLDETLSLVFDILHQFFFNVTFLYAAAVSSHFG